MNFESIKQHQDDDPMLQQLHQGLPNLYHTLTFGGFDLVCYVSPDNNPETQWSIYLTQQTAIPTICWFHQVLNHPGQEKIHVTIAFILVLEME